MNCCFVHLHLHNDVLIINLVASYELNAVYFTTKLPCNISYDVSGHMTFGLAMCGAWWSNVIRRRSCTVMEIVSLELVLGLC